MATFVKRKRKNHISWRAVIRRKGAKPVTNSFRSLTLAKDWARKAELEIQSGQYFKTVESARHTVADVIDRYKREVMPH